MKSAPASQGPAPIRASSRSATGFSASAPFASASALRFEGGVRREIRDLEILDPEGDDAGFWRLAWETVAAAAAKVVEERAARGKTPDIRVSGSFAPESETWSAIGGLLRGTFVRALDPRLGKPLGDDAGIRWDSPEATKVRAALKR